MSNKNSNFKHRDTDEKFCFQTNCQSVQLKIYRLITIINDDGLT